MAMQSHTTNAAGQLCPSHSPLDPSWSGPRPGRNSEPDEPGPSRSTGEYDPGISGTKARLTITVDRHVGAYAEHLVKTGHAASVSARLQSSHGRKAYRDRRRRSLWRARSGRADPGRVARMMAHIDRQLAQ